jgi:hypothetical protein
MSLALVRGEMGDAEQRLTLTLPTVMAWGTTWKHRPGSLYRLDKKGEVP